MPLCVNRTFFTACFLTSATAGGVNPCAAAPAAGTGCFQQISGRVMELNNNSVCVCVRSANVLYLHTQSISRKTELTYSPVDVSEFVEGVTPDLRFPGLIPLFRLPGRKSQVSASARHSRLFLQKKQTGLSGIGGLITPSSPRLLFLFIRMKKNKRF